MNEFNTPDTEQVEYFQYYDLSKCGFNFKQAEFSDENKIVLEDIIENFSSKFNIAPQITKDAFRVEFLSLRSTEGILILYNNKGNDDVYRIYTNIDTPTFKLFMKDE